jgi:drug/metabolite transporter (DMT)-like permease
VTVGAAAAREHAVAGMLLALAGACTFATMDTFVKLASQQVPVLQILLVVFVVHPLVPLLWALRRGSLAALRTHRPLVHFGRGLLMLAGSIGFFHALAALPLADAYALVFTMPLITTGLAVLMIGEAVGGRRLVAIAVGFLGVLVALRPGLGVMQPAALGALACAFCWGLANALVRRLGAVETAESFVVYGSLVVALGIAPGALWDWEPPSREAWLLMLAAGLCGGMAALMVASAFRAAPAALVAPFQYVQLPIGVVVGLLLFGDRPDALVLLGGAIVIGSGLYLLQHEAKAGSTLARRARPG